MYDELAQDLSITPPLKPQTTKMTKQQAQAQLSKAFQILTQLSPTTQQLSQCHSIIAQHMRQQYILDLLLHLTLKWSKTSPIATKLVISQISVYIKKQISFGCQKRHNKSRINKLFLLFFMNDEVQPAYKHMCQTSYMNFLFATHNELSIQQTIQQVHIIITGIYSTNDQCVKEFSQYANYTMPHNIFVPCEAIGNTMDTIKLLRCAGYLVKCLLKGGTLSLEQLKSLLNDSCGVYLRILTNMVKEMIVNIESKHEAGFLKSVLLCEQFMEIFTLLFIRADHAKLTVFKERLLRTGHIFRLGMIILNLNISLFPDVISAMKSMIDLNENTDLDQFMKGLPFDKLMLQVVMNSQNGNRTSYGQVQKKQSNQAPTHDKVFLSINKLKQQVFEIFFNASKILAKKSNKAELHFRNLTRLMGLAFEKIAPLIVKQMQYYLVQAEVRGKICDLSGFESFTNSYYHQPFIPKPCQQLYSKCLKFLGEIVKTQSHYHLAQRHRSVLIFQLCLPLLISRKQHERFEASDYIFYKQDIVSKQNLSYIQNSVAKLVQDYLDFIDGSVTQIFRGCMNLISFQLTASVQISNQLPLELRESWVLKHFSFDRLIQGCLMMLSLGSYLSESRNDLVKGLEQWLYKHREYFFRLDKGPLVNMCLILLYSYYCDDFYKNLVCGESTIELRMIHRKMMMFCCELMKANYDEKANKYPNKWANIVYLQSLNCLNNSFNHIQMFPAMYYEYPKKEELNIPHYFGNYENYPFYPIHNAVKSSRAGEEDVSLIDKNLKLSDKEEQKKNLSAVQRYQQSSKGVLVHYRQLGVNNEEFIYKHDILEIVQFLCSNLEYQSNIQILDLFIESCTQYLKHEIENQGSVLNIPIVFRDQVVTTIAIKLYSIFQIKPKKLPNLGLYQAKSTQLLYLLHSISSDAYFIYNMGIQMIWMNPQFWSFSATEQQGNIDSLLKCTDLVVRLALKHYSSSKGIDVEDLMRKIASNFSTYSFEYIKKIHKYNQIFGIFLNLILLQVCPDKIFGFLYDSLTQHFLHQQVQNDNANNQLIKDSLHSDQGDQDNTQNNDSKCGIGKISKLNNGIGQNGFNTQRTQKQCHFPSSTIEVLTKHTFYLFLINVYRNPQCLTKTNTNFKMLNQFESYLRAYSNKQGIVRQSNDVFGKVLCVCLCLLECQFGNLVKIVQQVKGQEQQPQQHAFGLQKLQFLLKNILFSSQVYKKAVQKRIVALKILSMFKKCISYQQQNRVILSCFTEQKVLQSMYQTACSCVFYVNNRDVMMEGRMDDMDNDCDDQMDWDFDQQGEQECWQHSPITTQCNDAELYIEDEVLYLKNITRGLLDSGKPQIKKWIMGIVERMPVAIKNFLKNKVLNYLEKGQDGAKDKGLRKIVRVKRPLSGESNGHQMIGNNDVKRRVDNDCEED